jgi:N-methylhydantoinase A/oxoprolinase/acetone carboxylase beta subunit
MRRGIRNLHGSMFDMFIEPYRPLVPRDLRFGVEERTRHDGRIETPLDENELRAAARKLLDEGCTAIAICFLHSYANGENELKAKRIVQDMAPEAYVTTSHETMPVWREFERFSTAVVSAYIGPAVTRYARKLQSGLKDHGCNGRLLMMLANGMVQVVDQCVDRAVYLLNSGPAAAPSAAIYLGAQHRKNSLLSMDMGGPARRLRAATGNPDLVVGRRTSGRHQDGGCAVGRGRRRINSPSIRSGCCGGPAERGRGPRSGGLRQGLGSRGDRRGPGARLHSRRLFPRRRHQARREARA